MPLTMQPDKSILSLEQQVVRLQALLEASRIVHSTLELVPVLEHAAQIAVRELEMDAALFQSPHHPPVLFGTLPEPPAPFPRFPLLSRAGQTLSELVIAPPAARELTLYEIDFLEGLTLQTAIAVENAINHERNLAYARLAQDLDAARTIQQSLLPQTMPTIRGYTLAARSEACYEVGGDFFDVVTEPDGSHLILVADVAGKGLASALVCTSFRSAFRALARQSLTLKELAARLSQQHWEEGPEARRRYVTAIFVRLDPTSHELEFVSAGHNPAFLITPGAEQPRQISASGTPVGLLPGARYTTERASFPPGARLLLYTDGLSEVFRETTLPDGEKQEEEFGSDRLLEAFEDTAPLPAEPALAELWATLEAFSQHAPQTDDMTAIALCRTPA